jgi:hypothetical protein
MADAIAERTDERCVTCDAGLTSPYCPSCGERRASDRSFSLREFAMDFLEAFASFDGRALRTAKLLLLRPGQLTKEYMRGCRLPYLAPLQCFLVFNVMYFAWATLTKDRTFATPLGVHMHFMQYSGAATRAVNARLATTGVDLAAFTRTFNAVDAEQSKSLVVAMVPLFALLTALVTLGRRRYAVQHLAFSLHVFAWIFCFIPVAHYAIQLPVVWYLTRVHYAQSALGYDGPISLALAICLAVYFALAVRRAYDLRWRRAAATGPLLVMCFYVSLQLYRALLFWVTFRSV